jgi:hypothetical protein
VKAARVLVLSTLCLMCFAVASGLQAAPRIDPSIAREAQQVESVEIMVTLVADRGPKPFALPRKVRTEEGRAWARSVVANLRGQGAPRVFDLGDGVIQATIRHRQ